MRDPEAKRQEAEDRLFMQAAREIHAQGAPWFSILDAAMQVAVENKKLRGWGSLGNRALRLFGAREAEALAPIESGLYAIAGRLQSAGRLEAQSLANGEATANVHLYRLIEEPETA